MSNLRNGPCHITNYGSIFVHVNKLYVDFKEWPCCPVEYKGYNKEHL